MRLAGSRTRIMGSPILTGLSFAGTSADSVTKVITIDQANTGTSAGSSIEFGLTESGASTRIASGLIELSKANTYTGTASTQDAKMLIKVAVNGALTTIITIDGSAASGLLTFAKTISLTTAQSLYFDSFGTDRILSSSAGVVDLYAGGANTLRLSSTAATITGTLTVSGALTLTATATPTGTGTGAVGQIAWDTAYLYVCTATNDWRRIALVDF